MTAQTGTGDLPAIADAASVVAFWREAGPERWFAKSDEFDRLVGLRLGPLCESAQAGSLDHWADEPAGALALSILLDQVPRNLHRATPLAYASDPKALAIAKQALERGFDQRVAEIMRPFFYLPLMHSENLADQERCLALYEAYGNAEMLYFARHHRDIIARFGRFPHRNQILGRETTPQEAQFLTEDSFRG